MFWLIRSRGSALRLRARPLAMLCRGDSLRELVGDRREGFRQAASMPVGRGAWRLAVDLNADGRIDVVTSNSESNSVSVLVGR
jgi:hypothetical protein